MAVVFVWHILSTTSCLRRDVLGSMKKKNTQMFLRCLRFFFLVNTFGFLGFCFFFFVVIVVVFYWDGHTIK